MVTCFQTMQCYFSDGITCATGDIFNTICMFCCDLADPHNFYKKGHTIWKTLNMSDLKHMNIILTDFHNFYIDNYNEGTIVNGIFFHRNE